MRFAIYKVRICCYHNRKLLDGVPEIDFQTPPLISLYIVYNTYFAPAGVACCRVT